MAKRAKAAKPWLRGAAGTKFGKRRPADLGRRIDLVRLLEFIDEFRRDRGYPPTTREIAAGLGLSSCSVAWYWAEAASRKGLLAKVSGAQRSFRLTSDGKQLIDEEGVGQLQARLEYYRWRVRALEAEAAELERAARADV